METQTLMHTDNKPIVQSGKPQPKWQRVTLLIVLGYEGAGAVLGGAMLISQPDGRLMKMPVEMMHGTFPDFLIPGIILFALGVLNSAAFFAVLRRTGADWILAMLASMAMIVWFWIEIAILLELHWLHAMWGLPVLIGFVAAIPLVPPEYQLKGMLFCGILSSLLYVAINIIVPLKWPAYDQASQTISELSAIGAPTRMLWNVLATPYTFLTLAFALGIWKAAGANHRLRIAGQLLIAYGLLGFLWPFAPMHLRETLAAGGGTFSDTMHLTLGAVTEIIYLVALAFTATAMGKGFRVYSIVTLVMLLLFGVLTFMQAPALPKNGPTPMIGVWERINIGLFLLWMSVLSVLILRGER